MEQGGKVPDLSDNPNPDTRQERSPKSGIPKLIVPILEILFLLLTVDLKAIQIQGDSLDRRGFGCSEGLDH